MNSSLDRYFGSFSVNSCHHPFFITEQRGSYESKSVSEDVIVKCICLHSSAAVSLFRLFPFSICFPFPFVSLNEDKLKKKKKKSRRKRLG